MRQRHLACVGVVLAVCLTGAAAQAHDHGHTDAAASAPSEETPFLAENAAAMDKMMADMDVKPTGDVDADFVAMMIPHHQGAIDMAKIELQYGKDPELKKLAEDIIKAQESEIAFLKAWLEKNAK